MHLPCAGYRNKPWQYLYFDWAEWMVHESETDQRQRWWARMRVISLILPFCDLCWQFVSWGIAEERVSVGKVSFRGWAEFGVSLTPFWWSWPDPAPTNSKLCDSLHKPRSTMTILLRWLLWEELTTYNRTWCRDHANNKPTVLNTTSKITPTGVAFSAVRFRSIS